MTDLGSAEFWQRLASEPNRLAAEICFVDVVNLDATLQKHASLRAWVNASHETARIQEERARWEVTKARAVAMLAAKAAENGGKSKTVQQLEAEVETTSEVQAATEKLLDAQEKRAALRAVTEALEDRAQMLIQLSSNRRQEQRDSSR